MKLDILEEVMLPEGVSATVSSSGLLVKGAKGEVVRKLDNIRVSLTVKGNIVEFASKKATKREKSFLYSSIAHLRNMMAGVVSPYTYTLKICSGHFPMTCTISNNMFTIKNFLGEKVPRTVRLRAGVSVKLDGDKVMIQSVNKELAGQTAADIEKATRISGKDLRVFQDGIYMIEKAGVAVEHA